MKATAIRLVPLMVVFTLLAAAGIQDEAEWEIYAMSAWGQAGQARLGNWYLLNALEPVSDEPEAGARHFLDRSSLASNAYEGTGGTLRVWQKTLLMGITKPYEEARAEIEKEEEKRLGRKLSVLDMAVVFPLAVNRAAKEIRTLFEINCESGEFIVLEMNLYDIEGSRMIRETNSNQDLWYPVQPGSVMDLLARKACGRAPI